MFVELFNVAEQVVVFRSTMTDSGVNQRYLHDRTLVDPNSNKISDRNRVFKR